MWYRPRFRDRRDGGKALTRLLSEYSGRDDVVILALPRGGVPVAYEVAATLNAPLDVFIVRKLGVPGHEELALGAIATGGTQVFNEDVVDAIRMPDEVLRQVIDHETRELQRRERIFREGRSPPEVKGKVVIIVDDGLATGATMGAAVLALKTMGPAELVVAVPVASQQACEELERIPGVRIVCVDTPEPFYGVGMWYEDFTQTTDEEVKQLIELSRPDVRRRAHAQ